MALCDLNLNLDLNNNMNIYASCKQFDTLNINFNIFKGGLAENLKDYKARLKAFKSDQTTLIQENTGVTLSDNVVNIKANEQLTNVSGKTIIELQFYNKTTGEKKSTYNIILTVYESSINVEGSISKSTYTLLEELEYKLDQATDFFENMEKATNINNELKLNITNGTTLNTTLKDNTDKGTVIDDSLKENIPKATEGNTTLLATVESAKTTKAGLDESIKKANDFINQNQNITSLQATVADNSTKITNLQKDTSQLSNPNLFINDSFKIWQRGTEFTPDALSFQYTCDRWRIGSDVEGSIQVTKSNNGIKIKVLKVPKYINFLQIIEDDTFKSINNKKVTVTFKLASSTDKVSQIWGAGIDASSTMVYHASNTFGGANSDIFSTTMTLKDGTTKNEFGIQFVPTEENQEFEILWAKFEAGEKATLFIPRPYGEELLLCQRYYQTHTIGGVANTPRVLGVNSRFVATMRIKPTITYGGQKTIHQHGVGGVGTTDDILEANTEIDRVDYVSTKEDKFTIGHTYNIEYVCLDAEIY